MGGDIHSNANAALDRIVCALNAVAFRRRGPTVGQVEHVWGDSESLVGYPPSAIRDSGPWTLVGDAARDEITRAHNSIRRPGDTVDVLVRARRRDGREVPVVIHSWGLFNADGSLWAIEGVATPARQSLEQNRLVRGFVHDLNNMLSMLSWAACRGVEMAGGNEALKDLLDGASRVAAAAGELTRSLARLGAPVRLGPTVLDDEIRCVAPLLRCLVGPTVDLITQMSAEGAAVDLGSCELQRVVLNLVSNAREAMPSGGTVGLRTSLCLHGGRRYVRLECADAGEGVSLDSLADLMEDGVSSKPGGAGLGLGIVRDLVRTAGGGIEVTNRPEGGTVFAVMLPVVDES